MKLRRIILTISLCFALGVGLAPTIPVAHACSCDIPTEERSLLFDGIEGDGDLVTETAYWPGEISLLYNADNDHPPVQIWLGGLTNIELRRVR